MHICHPHIVDVISASLEATNEVTLCYKVINYEGKVSVLEVTGLFMLDLNCRLLRPQYHFMEPQRLNNPEISFSVTWEKSVLNISEHVPITINYEQTTHLPMLHA